MQGYTEICGAQGLGLRVRNLGLAWRLRACVLGFRVERLKPATLSREGVEVLFIKATPTQDKQIV